MKLFGINSLSLSEPEVNNSRAFLVDTADSRTISLRAGTAPDKTKPSGPSYHYNVAVESFGTISRGSQDLLAGKMRNKQIEENTLAHFTAQPEGHMFCLCDDPDVLTVDLFAPLREHGWTACVIFRSCKLIVATRESFNHI